MIFASDLDGTLIFSKRLFIGVTDDANISLVEKKLDKEISYMTQKSIEILKSITSSINFIPATTRTVDQYKRIAIFQNTIISKYAIVSNGGKILINNEIDNEWEDYINSELKKIAVSPQEIFDELYNVIPKGWIESFKFADELFWVFITDENRIPYDELKSYIILADEKGWRVSHQGRKLYIIPKVINKAIAVEYLRKKIGCSTVIAAGDSLLDYDMIKNSEISYIPQNGELIKYINNENINISNAKFIEKAGIMAGEEILKEVYKKVMNL